MWIIVAACEVVTSPLCGLWRHCFSNLHHWLISWYLKFFDDFSVVSCLISFRVFVKEQLCIFCPVVGVLWRCVCFHHWFWFPGSSCCLLSGCQFRAQLPTTAPPRPRGCSLPIHLPFPVLPPALVIAMLWVCLVGFVLCLHVSLNGVFPPEQ